MNFLRFFRQVSLINFPLASSPKLALLEKMTHNLRVWGINPIFISSINVKTVISKNVFYVVCHEYLGKFLRSIVWSCGKNSFSSFKNHFHTLWFFGSYISKFNKICKVWLEAWKVCSIQKEKICQKGKMSHILRSPRNPLRPCHPWQ